MTRAMIVDDERLARDELRFLLRAHPEIDVVAEAEDVESAIATLPQARPQLLFLDVQLGSETGFDLVEHVPAGTGIIFVTAYDRHAVRAFDVNALDYLLKPVNPARLGAALDRVQTTTKPSAPLTIDDRLFLPDDPPTFLALRDVVCITGADDYTRVVTTDGRERLVHKSLREWEERLPVRSFLRVHRSTIIGIEHVARFEPWSNRSYQVFMHGRSEAVLVSRRYAARMRAQLG